MVLQGQGSSENNRNKEIKVARTRMHHGSWSNRNDSLTLTETEGMETCLVVESTNLSSHLACVCCLWQLHATGNKGRFSVTPESETVTSVEPYC
jgi:hypothetical protein